MYFARMLHLDQTVQTIFAKTATVNIIPISLIKSKQIPVASIVNLLIVNSERCFSSVHYPIPQKYLIISKWVDHTHSLLCRLISTEKYSLAIIQEINRKKDTQLDIKFMFFFPRGMCFLFCLLSLSKHRLFET